MTISLNPHQRLALENLINNTQKGTIKDLLLWGDILDKIVLTEEERSVYFKSLPDGRVLMNQLEVNEARPLELTLEKEEQRKLLGMLQEVKDFTPADLKWVRPVLDQLTS